MYHPLNRPLHLAHQKEGPRQPRLLIIVNDAAFFVSHRLPIAVAALEAGYEVAVAVPSNCKARQKIENKNIRFLELPLPRGKGRAKDEFFAIRTMWNLIGDFQPDLVHLVTAKPVIFGGLLCRFRQVPILAAISGLGHSFVFDDLKSRLQRLALLLGYGVALKRNCAIAVFQNEENLRIFREAGIIGDRHVMIRGSGAKLSDFDPAPPSHEELTVLMPSRMLWTKGVGEFVEAARLLKARGFRARFTLAGSPDEGNPASISAHQLSAWHEEGVIEWLGFQSNIAATLKKSDVVALPSYYPEGLPKSLIDASAAGRPIVTTNVPGCRDAIIEGQTGFLCRPRDSEDLANKIELLLGDESSRLKMGRAARVFAEREFAIEEVVARHLDCYAALLHESWGQAQ